MNPPLNFDELMRYLATLAACVRPLPDGGGVLEFSLSKSQSRKLRSTIRRIRSLLDDPGLTDAAIIGLAIEHMVTEFETMEADSSNVN